MNRIPALLLALACWLSAGTVRAALTDPAQIQTEAYVNLVQGDQSLDAGRLDEALAQYQMARDYYYQLAKDFPGWEPRVVQYRMTFCDNQIADVERRMSGDLPEELPELPAESSDEPRTQDPSAPLRTAAAAPTPSSAAGRSVEIDYLKSRIASLEAELSEFDALQDGLDALTEQNAQLRKDVDAANQKLAARADGEQSALKELQSELAAKENQFASLQKEIDAKQQLDQALNELEGKVNELRTENDRLNKEIKTLDEELDSAEIRADQAELKAKQVAESLKDSEQDLKKASRLQADNARLEKKITALDKKLDRAEDRADQAETEAKQAAKRQKMAEKDLKKARRGQTHTEKQLAALQRKPIFKKSASEKSPSKKTAQATSSEPAEEPSNEEPAADLIVASPVAATLPPKTIPDGMAAADYVRQLLQEGDNEAALATVQAARATAPADMNLTLIEGIALIRLQRYPEAAEMLIDLARNNPRNAEVHATLGAAMMGAGLYPESRETLLMAYKLDRNLPEVLYNLAQLYAFIEPINLKLARKYYKQSLDLGLAADKQLEKALKK